MARYSTIWSDLWDDERFYQKCSDRAKLLYIFIISNHAANLIGYYRIPRPLAISSLGFSASELEITLDELVQAGLILISDNRLYILIKGYLKFNKIKSPSHYKKLKVELEHIERNSLDLIFIEEVCRFNYTDASEILQEYIPDNMKELENVNLPQFNIEDTS